MTACQHKRLCEAYECPSPRLWVAADYRQEREIPYIGLTDWEMNWPSKFGIAYDELRPALPQGPRMSFYADDALLGSTNLPTHDGQYRRQYGDYTLLFHNNDTEYIMFEDMNHFSTARATTRKVTRSQDGTQTAPPSRYALRLSPRQLPHRGRHPNAACRASTHGLQLSDTV